MYHVVFGFLYLFSLLPLRVLYLFSDLAYIIIYYFVGYRKDVVMNNLSIAFPEKTGKERIRIAKEFYKTFSDSFIETIKMISIGKKALLRRAKVEYEVINELIAKGRNIHLLAGHQFNWEFGNLGFSMQVNAPFIVVYAPIGNRIFDRIFYNFRQRYGSTLVSTREFSRKMHSLFNQQYVLVLAADQNPSNPKNAYWLDFFDKSVPFVKGPGKGAVKNNTSVVFIAMSRKKRGHYEFSTTVLTENGAGHTPEELTIMYKKILEDTIRKNPSNYLWSHRRWRHEWKEEYGAKIQS